MALARVFADFHNADASGRVRLNCAGTLHDLAAQGVTLRPGLALRLYSEELEADGVVEFSEQEKLWVAAIDWRAIAGARSSWAAAVEKAGAPGE
jgi:hypothetical protein